MKTGFKLLLVEAQEERERALLAIWLGLGAAAFGLLSGVTLTVLIAVALWEHSHVVALLVLALIYLIAAVVFTAGSSVCNGTGRLFPEPWTN
ncbi:MAG: phage holin family protein [Limisphaerales bacterium]